MLIGFRSHGKTSLLEALLGQQLGSIGFTPVSFPTWTCLTRLDNLPLPAYLTFYHDLKEGCTKRPVYYQFVNTPGTSASNPKCSIQFDPFCKDRNVEVALKNLPREIAKRSPKLSAEPIYVTIRMPNTLDITFIDTPGLISSKVEGADELKAQTESIVLSVAQESDKRIFVFVEEAVSWKDASLLPFARMINPSFHRACIVFTKFHNFITSVS